MLFTLLRRAAQNVQILAVSVPKWLYSLIRVIRFKHNTNTGICTFKMIDVSYVFVISLRSGLATDQSRSTQTKTE